MDTDALRRHYAGAAPDHFRGPLSPHIKPKGPVVDVPTPAA